MHDLVLSAEIYNAKLCLMENYVVVMPINVSVFLVKYMGMLLNQKVLASMIIDQDILDV